MANNPYTPPRAAVADIHNETETQAIKLWSASGRIGRLRYWAYTMSASLLIGLVVGLLTAVMGPGVAGVVAILLYIPLLVFVVLILIQRTHDMGWNGWMCLLSMIPLVGLLWLFKPGTPGSNEYGAPPPPNTTGVKILGLAMPIVLIAVIAAIAIPAYQQYVQRAQEMEFSQPTEGESEVSEGDMLTEGDAPTEGAPEASEGEPPPAP
jgi:uncharacterized membrane protein YhaH (DUF805 family)